VPETQVKQVVEVGYGGNERLMMNMGPQHPSSHGVFRMILTLEGETVVGVDAVIGYPASLPREARREPDLRAVPRRSRRRPTTSRP